MQQLASDCVVNLQPTPSRNARCVVQETNAHFGLDRGSGERQATCAARVIRLQYNGAVQEQRRCNTWRGGQFKRVRCTFRQRSAHHEAVRPVIGILASKR
ncbi:hypothetical protein D3C71_1737330 [compost metagenome]